MMINNNNLKNNSKQMWWLVGFTDGDGGFHCVVNKQNKAMQFKLRYHIHKDDIICLENIKNILNINLKIYFSKDKDLISIDILNQSYLKDIIIPIFINYPLLTIKYYSFLKWNKQFNIYINKEKSLEWHIENKKLINNYEHDINIPIPYNLININWLIGFIEAEGYLNFNPGNKTKITVRGMLTITQDKRSLNTLITIKNLITLWSYHNNTPLPIKLYLDEKLNINKNWVFINKESKLGIHLLSINNIDMLYYIVLPKLKSELWYTRKKEDFYMWEIGLTIIIRGLHHTSEGLNLLNELHDNINKKRYNKSYIIPYDNINKVINIKSIYNYNLPYNINTLINTKKRGGVYMFNLDNKLIKIFKGELLASKYFNVARHLIHSYINNNTIIDNKYIIKNYDYFINSKYNKSL